MQQLFFNRSAGESTGTLSENRDWRHPLWLALLVSASVVFGLGLACAVPLAAFAAAAALSLSRRDALLLIALVWLANQLVGFTLLDYPWTASTFAWGVVLGVVAVLVTLAAQWVVRRLSYARRAFTVTATPPGPIIAFVDGVAPTGRRSARPVAGRVGRPLGPDATRCPI